jgi:predicted DCC family thiol-disulfide oxidoreductase YuxK
MQASPEFPLKVFYDGSCSVCAREMDVYRRKEHGGRLLFVDISIPDFDPTPYGITLPDFMHEMHAIDHSGGVYRGVEAFRAIWQAFPASTRYGALGWLIALPGVHLLARLTYWSFARMRNYLPKSREACKDGACGIGKGKSPQ